MASLKEVAKMAGVSMMTVSRVINKNGYVKDETRKRIEEAIKELNYYPNNLARGLNKNNVKVLSVMASIGNIPMEGNPYFTRLLQGVEENLLKNSYDILLSTKRRKMVDGILSYDYFRTYLERKSDGLILIGAKLTEQDKDFINSNSIPLCIIGDRPNLANINIVDSKNKEGMKKLLNIIYDMGHRKICFGGADPSNYNIEERLDAYKEFLEEKNLPFNPEYVINCSHYNDDPKDIFKSYLNLADKPTVIACSTDNYAIQVILEARKHKIRVPQDLCVTGFDGSPLGQFLMPKLTTMRQDLETMGAKAAELVLDSINNPEKEGTIWLCETDFIEGESLVSLQ